MGIITGIGGLSKRMISAGRAAWAAFNNAPINSTALTSATTESGWETFSARYARYTIYDSYFNNTVYTLLEQYSATKKLNSTLYKHIRGIHNPVSRLVKLYISKVYGGSLDYVNMTTGAIPIAEADKALRGALKALWLSSNWQKQKSLYVRQGALYGDTLIKIVDDTSAGRVRMEVMHPGKLVDARYDAVGNILAAKLAYQIEHPEKPGQSAIYMEEITEEYFKTYLDDSPYGFFTDGNGKKPPQWDNQYGFVPLVHVQHEDNGLHAGINAFHTGIRKIDEINDAASLLNDQVRKVITPLWYFAGAGASDITVNGSGQGGTKPERDMMPAIYGPEGSQPYPMVAPIDIAAARANIDKLLEELEADLPELALRRLREGGQLTAPGVRAGYSDATDRITEARGNYDEGLIRAHKMGISIGGFRGYDGFKGYDLGSFDAGDLDHYIVERAVIEDQLSVQEKLAALEASGAPQSAIWAEMGYSEDTIRKWQAELQNTAAAQEAANQNMIDAAAKSRQMQAAMSGADKF